MQPFELVTPADITDAIERGRAADAAYLAGGTNVVDFLRTGAMRALTLIDVDVLPLRGIDFDGERLRIGALTRMSGLAAEPAVRDRYDLFRDRFLRESELAASIDQPNIVPIYEAGRPDDRLFIALRYVAGRDLKERLRHGRMNPAEAIGVVAQVASALDAAHARGLVHRDVKPSNVLLDRGARPDGSDHVYLADFGLMRLVAEEAGTGDDGHLMGTIDYVAPEQIAGEDRVLPRFASPCDLGATCAWPPAVEAEREHVRASS